MIYMYDIHGSRRDEFVIDNKGVPVTHGDRSAERNLIDCWPIYKEVL